MRKMNRKQKVGIGFVVGGIAVAALNVGGSMAGWVDDGSANVTTQATTLDLTVNGQENYTFTATRSGFDYGDPASTVNNDSYQYQMAPRAWAADTLVVDLTGSNAGQVEVKYEIDASGTVDDGVSYRLEACADLSCSDINDEGSASFVPTFGAPLMNTAPQFLSKSGGGDTSLIAPSTTPFLAYRLVVVGTDSLAEAATVSGRFHFTATQIS